MTETIMHSIDKITTSRYNDSRPDGSEYSVTKITFYDTEGNKIHTVTTFGTKNMNITKEGK